MVWDARLRGRGQRACQLDANKTKVVIIKEQLSA